MNKRNPSRRLLWSCLALACLAGSVDGAESLTIGEALKKPDAWFYEIGTNRPFYCGRDGIKKFNLSEIEPERRNGYAWHGGWGNTVQQRFAVWQREHKSL